MTHTDFLTSLGAPLVNPAWSWGSVRECDGAVFLMVWQHGVVSRQGSLYVQITSREKHVDKPNDRGLNERLGHIDLIRRGARCYLLMCKAVDPNAAQHVREKFERGNVFTAGEIIECEDGNPISNLGHALPKRR